jgi:hypothetical protein
VMKKELTEVAPITMEQWSIHDLKYVVGELY